MEVGKTSSKYNELKQQLEMNQRQVELVNERLKHTVHHQVLEEVNGLRQSIGTFWNLSDTFPLSEEGAFAWQGWHANVLYSLYLYKKKCPVFPKFDKTKSYSWFK